MSAPSAGLARTRDARRTTASARRRARTAMAATWTALARRAAPAFERGARTMSKDFNETEMSVARTLMNLCEDTDTGRAVTFRELGVLSSNEGFELQLPNGQTFQVTVVEGRRR